MNELNITQIKPLLLSYGGGHSHIIYAVAQELIKQGCDPTVIGLTTASSFYNSKNLLHETVASILDNEEPVNNEVLSLVDEAIKNESHPSIKPEHTRAYFTIGILDLVEEYGVHKAEKMIKQFGRKSFLPVKTIKKYLSRIKPDIVVTTTSPRFELATLRAARSLGIPTLAIGDLFLLEEKEWILQGLYAEHLAVFAELVKSNLISEGLKNTEVHVTGNPAFDIIKEKSVQYGYREYLRRKFRVHNKKVIFWPAAQLNTKWNGEFLARPRELVTFFEEICRIEPNFTYIIRPHPNSPFELGSDAINGFLDDGQTLEPEDAILMSDIVCSEVSTMGLQAALMGKPSICVKYEKDAVFPLYGMGMSVKNFNELKSLLLENNTFNFRPSLDYPEIGGATERVTALISQILTKE